jgi:hypothetical protein
MIPMTRTCPSCNEEYETKSQYGSARLPDRSTTPICRPCHDNGAFQNRLNAMTWEQGKALKRDLRARRLPISRSYAFGELKDAVLGLVFGTLIAVGGIALALGSRGMVIAWGPVLACTYWAIKCLFATGNHGYEMWSWRRRWQELKG